MDDAKQAARLCGLNLLLQLKQACGGTLDYVKRCVKLTVYMQCDSNFQDHAQVANGVSDLMVEVFGDIGHHSRTAVGAISLPSDTAVEVDAIFEV
ncbi:MAG: RidA family protein [Rickettsiales bacterium]|nr:RidA family protein [Rickettsiales bacterium]